MTRRIVHLIEEQENKLETRDLGVKFERTRENRALTLDNEEELPLNLMKYHQQHEVIMPSEDKNQNGKRNLVTQIIGKKARKLSKKKAKLEKLQEDSERTSQKEKSLEFELRRNIRAAQIGTLPWWSNITIGGIMTVTPTLQNG
jgi:hypothetical protein